MDKTAERFRQFRLLLDASAASNELLRAEDIRIEPETKLLGEIEDIRDELSILRLVLEDQKSIAEELDTLLDDPSSPEDPVIATNTTAADQSYTLKGNRVLKSHLARIERMENLTKRSIQSVRNFYLRLTLVTCTLDMLLTSTKIRSLLKLKQQHASLSEAHSARKQAEYTSRQTHVATSYNKKVSDQLNLARQQAEETARQGNVILLFTVVTVVFVSSLYI